MSGTETNHRTSLRKPRRGKRDIDMAVTTRPTNGTTSNRHGSNGHDSSGPDRAEVPDGLERIGRAGWVAKGAVYALIGALAVPIALGNGSGDDEASRSGALAEIAESSWGGVLLVVAAVGLFLYAGWRLTTAVLPGDNDAETWAHRIGYGVSAAIYGFLGWSALSFVTSSGDSSSPGGSGDESMVEKLSRTLMETTGGRWLLGALGLIMVGVAAYYVYKAVDKRFLERIDTGGASSTERTVIEKLGVAGWIGRGITMALLGFFVLQAAWNANPDEAEGLDAALRETADGTLGSILVLVAGIALISYGIFAVVSARHRRLLGP